MHFPKIFIVIFLLFLHVSPLSANEEVKLTVSGYVRDSETGEELIGVTIYIEELKSGTISNAYGFYSLTLPDGRYTIIFSYIGYHPQNVTISTGGATSLNIDLVQQTVAMEELIITDTPLGGNVTDVSMSKINISAETVKKLPALFGEPDILKSIQMMPGVISAGEGTSAFFVRGGSSDQNLILIDEAPVYEPSHLFGLFSVFNADAIKDSELYKGGIPAQYGGRLSSILDVRTKDGNSKKFGMSGGIGTIASRLMLEGPIKKDKSSFLVSGRRSYLDVFQRTFGNEAVSENFIYFHDFNVKLNFKPTNRDRFFLNTYYGRDSFIFGDDAKFDWGNANASFRYNHLFSDKLFANTSVIGSNFDYKLSVTDALKWTANLQELVFKQDFSWFVNPDNEILFGYHGTFLRFSPGRIEPESEEAIFVTTTLERLRAFDHALYIGNKQKVSDKISLEYGLRYSFFQNVGAATIYYYDDQTDNINTGNKTSVYYESLELIKDFHNLEPRFSFRYLVNPTTSLKFSYNRMVQNVHLMSNSTVPVPFNTWQPSSPYLDPEKADQVAGGYFKNFKDNMFGFSFEAYYKYMYNVVDFADHANVFFNEDLATEFRPGDSWSYGLEFFLQKHKGDLTGSASYTWSNTKRKIPGVNNGEVFYANYHRSHVMNLLATYEINDKWLIGGTWTYSTGRPQTMPTGWYELDGYRPDYVSGRNGYLLPDFHRLDLSATLTPRKNKDRRWNSSWVFAVYNVYNRKNAFTIFTRSVTDDDGNIDRDKKEAVMVYLFPILPSVTYNFRF
ncbi:carboxypeptidase-like regulatory domain-containing protein [Bacteroidota bacterium]